jgi:hypothetical protein
MAARAATPWRRVCAYVRAGWTCVWRERQRESEGVCVCVCVGGELYSSKDVGPPSGKSLLVRDDEEEDGEGE